MAKKKIETPEIFKVEVNTPLLNIRNSHGYDAEIIGTTIAGSVFEIVSTADGWGELAEGKGWICLDFADKIEE